VGKNPYKRHNHAGLRVLQKWAKSGHNLGKVGRNMTKTSLQHYQFLPNIINFSRKTHFGHFHKNQKWAKRRVFVDSILYF
jgi:hypothetical protein